MKASLPVKKITRSTPDSVTLWFEKTEPLMNYSPGQHVSVTINIDGVNVSRTYSLNTSPYADRDIAITIRKIENGVFSTYLVNNAFEGMAVMLEGPLGEFKIEPKDSERKHFVMFAAGSGITPIMSMLKSILHSETTCTVSLMYTNKSYSSIIFKEELFNLEQTFPNRLKVYHILTRDEHFPKDFSVFHKGRPSKLIIKKMLKTILAEITTQVEYYLCGPFSFMHFIEDTIHLLSPGKANIFKEHFFIPDEKKDEFDFLNLTTREVIIEVKGEEKILIVEGGKSMLQAALESGIRLSYSCTEGQCGICRAQLISGQVKLRKNHILTEDELNRGEILLCQGFPVSDGVFIKSIL